MMIYPKTEGEWHALRHKFITSTQAAALCGLGDYQTPYEVGLEKQAKEPPGPLDLGERVAWGQRMQEAIAKGISDEYGVKVRRIRGFAAHPDGLQLGASFDYEVVGIAKDEAGNELVVKDMMLQQMYRDLGPGVLEIKTVDGLIFKKRWHNDEGEVEAPPQIEIQVQHQLECIGTRKWAAIGVLIGGNELQLIIRERDEDFGAHLREVIANFWVDLAKGKLPPVTLPADIEIIRKLYVGTTTGKIYKPETPEEEKELQEWCKNYLASGELAKAHEEARKTLGARILERIGDAEFASIFGYGVKTTTVAETVVKAFTRKPYRRMTIKELAVKPAEESEE